MFALYHKRTELGYISIYFYAKYIHYLSIPPLRCSGLIREAEGEGDARNNSEDIRLAPAELRPI